MNIASVSFYQAIIIIAVLLSSFIPHVAHFFRFRIRLRVFPLNILGLSPGESFNFSDAKKFIHFFALALTFFGIAKVKSNVQSRIKRKQQQPKIIG